MGAVIAAILKTPGATTLLGKVVSGGSRKLSRTKIGANLAIAGAGWEAIPGLLPLAMEGNPEAIGKLALIVGGWGLALWGRGSKG